MNVEKGARGRLIKILERERSFLIPYSLFLVIALPIVGLVDRKALHLYMNRFCYPLLDPFFATITHLGDGFTAFLIGLFLLFHRVRNGLLVFTATLCSGMLVQFLKRVVFPDVARPLRLIGREHLHLVAHVDLHSKYAFPSGHAATAFALFLCLAMLSRRHSIKVFCFCMACLVAFSRVYISQHFAIDVVFGSLIGVLFA